MFLTIAGNRIFSVAYGTAPRTFVSHGGWAGNWELFAFPMEQLSHSWRTIAYDHRGAGESAVPVECISFDALVSDLFHILDAYAIHQCVVSGESAGAGVVMQAVLQRPERFTGLVLIDGGAGVVPPGSAPPPGGLGLPSTWPGDDFRARMRWFAELCIPEPDSEHVRRWATDLLVRAGPEAADRLWAARGGPRLDHTARLGEIALPTLIIRGSLDPLMPAATAEYLAAQIPQSRLVTIAGAGHVPTMTRPNEVVQAITDFFG
jgi:pimeloyl-ACP methyl ester carboxylesterase